MEDTTQPPHNLSASVPQGSGNTIVQIIGDHNTVGPGEVGLTRFATRRVVRRDLDRLSPYTFSTPLIGREPELGDLRRWLGDERRILARIVIGAGGRGKTRLALELCEWASQVGWDAGFMREADIERLARDGLASWYWKKPTLVVIDYAAQHAKLLKAVVAELSDRSDPPSVPLRLLLLERDASLEAGWGFEVFGGGGFGDSGKVALLDPPKPIVLPPLQDDEERMTLVEATFGKTEAGAGALSPQDRTILKQRLKDTTWAGDPLYLMMAALAGAQLGHAKALELRRTDLATELARREAKRIRELAVAKNLDGELAVHFAACVTLTRGMERVEFEPFAARERQSIHRTVTGDTAAYADVLVQALPSPEGIAAVQPDLIGEAFILNSIGNASGTDVAMRCLLAEPERALQMIARCAEDFFSTRTEPLDWLVAFKERFNDDEVFLDGMQSSLPGTSGPLSGITLSVSKRLVELRSQQRDVPGHVMAETFTRHAIASFQVEELEAAVESSKKATAIYRDIYEFDQRVGMLFATSLSYLAGFLRARGQHAQARVVVQECVDVFHAHISASSAVSLRYMFGYALLTLSRLVGATQETALALPPAEEAAEVYRKLVFDDKDEKSQGFLADTLLHMARLLCVTGGYARALKVLNEAGSLISADDPLASELAELLNSLSTLAYSDGGLEVSIAAAEAAVPRYRALAAHAAEVHLPELGRLLVRLSGVHVEARQGAKALDTVVEMIAVHQQLATLWPDDHLRDRAMALSQIVRVLLLHGGKQIALTPAQEAARLMRRIADPQSADDQFELADALQRLCIVLLGVKQYGDAVTVAQELVAMLRPLAANDPDRFRTRLAAEIGMLGTCKMFEGSIREARDFSWEALTLLKDDFVRSPETLADLVGRLGEQYLFCCNDLKEEPDRELIETLRSAMPKQESRDD